jgi:hypothetical protein
MQQAHPPDDMSEHIFSILKRFQIARIASRHHRSSAIAAHDFPGTHNSDPPPTRFSEQGASGVQLSSELGSGAEPSSVAAAGAGAPGTVCL